MDSYCNLYWMDKGCWNSLPRRRAGNLRTHELFPVIFRKVSFHTPFKGLLAQWELEMSAGKHSQHWRYFSLQLLNQVALTSQPWNCITFLFCKAPGVVCCCVITASAVQRGSHEPTKHDVCSSSGGTKPLYFFFLTTSLSKKSKIYECCNSFINCCLSSIDSKG